jgi:hypothetical protein
MTPVVDSFKVVQSLEDIDYFLVSDKNGEKKRLPKEVFISHIREGLEDSIKFMEDKVTEMLNSIDIKEKLENLSVFDKGLINLKNVPIVEKDEDIKEGSLYYTRDESNRPIIRLKTKDKWITI